MRSTTNIPARVSFALAAAVALLLSSSAGAQCLGDTDDSGTVDIDDVINVVLDFGRDGSANGGDVDQSGVVDIDDVVLVVLEFGPCPGA